MTTKMNRTQFYLEPEIKEELERLARRLGVSQAELIRKAIRDLVREKGEIEDPLLGIIGLGKGEGRAISEEHDQYLAEEEKTRWQS